MKFELRVKGLNQLVARFNSQRVVVSVPDGMKAAVPVRGSRNSKAGLTTRKVSPVQGNTSLKFVLGILNKRRGILDKALSKATRDERKMIAGLFWEIAESSRSAATSKIKQLETLCAELVRRPIRGRKYGPNHPETVRNKGFDHYAVDTGRLIKNLKGKYRK